MKRALFVFSMVLFLGLSTQAHALLNGSRITSVIKIDDETCAITLDANGSGLLDILSLDQLLVNDDMLANLGGLIQRLLSLDLSVVNEVLAASPAFASLTGLTPDIHLDNEDCYELQAGNVLKIAVPGPLGLLGPLKILDTLPLPVGFDDLTSLLVDEDGNLTLVSLVEDVLEVVGIDTEGVIGGGNGNVGGNPPGGETPDGDGAGGTGGNADGEDSGAVGELPGNAASGGCSLAVAPTLTLDLLAWFGAATALFVSRKRKN